LERDDVIGGYCKTVYQDGFVWDYSGHFFHFRHPEIEHYLVQRMPVGEVETINKCSKILYKDRMLDFPFQKNIHQLPQDEFIECLYDLFFLPQQKPNNFKEMVYGRFGSGIAEKFLIPYNEKLYACDLSTLDPDAMGRFFPYADLESIVRNFRQPDNSSYNSTFTYPRSGAIAYINALASAVRPDGIALNEPIISIDIRRKIATTATREIAFEYLISSAAFPQLLRMTQVAHEQADFRWNKVLIFNLGFDRKAQSAAHWIYCPETRYCFYRVGFYDNIFQTDRLSLYIEIGYPSDATPDSEAMLQHTLSDLRLSGIITDHKLLSYHSVILDPAYVHITQNSNKSSSYLRQILAARGIYSIGRYGGWTYCSIEDNILEAQQLANILNTAD
jgi:protoporphyrinogen oxidase